MIHFNQFPSSLPSSISTVARPKSASPVQFAGLGQAVKNLGRAHNDFWFNALQDPLILKDNALILSSFLLVISRLAAANNSALQYRGTTEEHHRRSEALKTVLREVGGFSFSFVVLRMIQFLSTRLLQKFFGLPDTPGLMVHTLRHTKASFKAGLKGQPAPKGSNFIAPEYTAPKDPRKLVQVYQNVDMDKFFKTKVLTLQGEKKIAQINANMRTFMKYAPIAIGSIPAILLSGYFLERFTQEHSQEAVEKFSNWLNKQT